MDFLATVKKRLEELEEQSRQMQALAPGVKPVGKPVGRALSSPRPKTAGRQDVRKSVSAQPTSRRLASSEAFATPECATGGPGTRRTQSESAGLPAKPLNRRLIDDLRGRLDEAFLLSEVLGAPRCVRGWDDD